MEKYHVVTIRNYDRDSPQVVSYNSTLQPPTAQVVSTRTNRLLMRRYAVVQQARDADVIGILVGTLGVGTLKTVSLIPVLKRSDSL